MVGNQLLEKLIHCQIKIPKKIVTFSVGAREFSIETSVFSKRISRLAIENPWAATEIVYICYNFILTEKRLFKQVIFVWKSH